MKYLNIDSDIDIAETHAKLWAERGIGYDRVDTMIEGIQKLLANAEYLCVAINGDAVDFMPLLSTMRSITDISILIVTGSFTTDKEVKALENGADLYARWHEKPEDNIASVLAHVKRKAEREKMPAKILTYDNILLNPVNHQVFIGDTEIKLTKKEFDVLQTLMRNKGHVLEYSQLLGEIWGEDYSEEKILWRTVDRIRGKLSEISPDKEYIRVERGIGYKFLS